jgi:ATP-dependent Lon protease
MSLVRGEAARLRPDFKFEAQDIHIHVPAGSIPKDGPSAGITILSALASLLTGRTIEPTLGLTGEITLRGAVLPVGGIKEKVLAAHRAGIKTIILPRRNEADLSEVPEDVRLQLKFSLVENVEEGLAEALNLPQPLLRQTAA